MIFAQIHAFLTTGKKLQKPTFEQVRDTLVHHLEELYNFYGEHLGVRVARKHISWYTKGVNGSHAFRQRVNIQESTELQLTMIQEFFDQQIQNAKVAA